MKRMGGWLSAKTPVTLHSSASKSLTAVDEPYALQQALAAAAHIMNDDVDLAETELRKGTSPFHKLGIATTFFLRATLGFEKEVIEAASQRLAEAEESALEHQRRALRDPGTAHRSSIYPVGAEYALCHAETQLMSAVVAVLNESLTESLRGFYKLRKAFGTLWEISEAERIYLEKRGLNRGSVAESKVSLAGSTVAASESSGVQTPRSKRDSDSEDEDEDLEFVDADEGVDDLPTPTAAYQGHLDDLKLNGLSLSDSDTKQQPPSQSNGIPSKPAASSALDDLDFNTVTSDPIDLFIHSGTALCFGLLQLLLSMVPPTFAKLLSLFSFRGNRANGMRLLWSATRFKTNINGAMASLITLGFHNGAIAFCDILSSDALPEERLRVLLKEMRTLYPKSKLWLLEEARVLSRDHELEKAIAITEGGEPSPLKQVEALRVFERSLNFMYLHRYEDCAKSFLHCIELNNWSHALYYYIAASCYVGLYRLAKAAGDAKEAKRCEEEAERLFKIVPAHIGKKRFMARQLPFDTFVARKLEKITARAATLSCSYIDAIGVSPLEEMIYFWSGYKRMPASQLEISLERLAFSTARPTWSQEQKDEKAIHSLLQATAYRFLGRVPEAIATLKAGALAQPMAALRTCPFPDTWTVPVGHYEMAVCLWEAAGGEGGDREGLRKCGEELAKCEKSEGYDLDARVGLKVTTARETLRGCGVPG
nr:hypothetical protein B0A51_11060 [Rachicladosporium sp. CCFEE 5018]